MDQKVHLGLCENGHYVFPFPFNDIGRQKSWTSSKNTGSKKANLSLIETCEKLHPDILFLGHAQLVARETLEIIRKRQPSIKIVQWWCDWFYSEKSQSYATIYDHLDLLDCFFATTAGDKLKAFEKHSCRTAYIPNLVHKGVERGRSFELNDHDYDLVFIGSDRKVAERRDALLEIKAELGDQIRIGIFGSLNEPGVYGHEKENILLNSKAALNLSRLPEKMKWYSSDRIGSLLGNGLLCCTRVEADLNEIYGDDTMVYYKDTVDLIEQLREQLDNDLWRETARRGYQLTHDFFNSKRITELMIDFIDGRREDCLNLQENDS